MAQVYMPEKKSNNGIFQLGGAIVGGVLGGYATESPQGAMAGATAGAGLGGLAGQQISPDKPQPQPLASNTGSAMERRRQQLENDPLMQLKQAEVAVAKAPEPVQTEYGPAIQRARMLEEQRRGIA